MQTRALGSLLAFVAVACNSTAAPAPPIEGPVRGLGFDAPIDPVGVSALRDLGRVLSVVHSARVVIVMSDSAPERLQAVAGATHVGPIIGDTDDLEVQVEVVFARTPIVADLVRLRAIGSITAQLPEYRAVFLHVRLAKLAQLDQIQNAESVWVGYDPPRLQAGKR